MFQVFLLFMFGMVVGNRERCRNSGTEEKRYRQTRNSLESLVVEERSNAFDKAVTALVDCQGDCVVVEAEGLRESMKSSW